MYWIDKLYIACRKQDRLVFITPHGTDKTFDTRKITADKWAGVDREELIIDNKFETGYKLLSVTSRSSNQNKVWDVQSPHGFACQIQSDNLDHIFDNSDIIGRMIVKPCAFLRKNNTNFLVVENSEDHINAEYKLDLPKIKKPKVGHLYKTSMGEVVFLGDIKAWYYYHYSKRMAGYVPINNGYSVRNKKLITVKPEYYEDLGMYHKSVSEIIIMLNISKNNMFYTHELVFTENNKTLKISSTPTNLFVTCHDTNNTIYLIEQ